MPLQATASAILGAAGTLAAGLAVWNERCLQRHRRPGVTYLQVTMRRDGAWRRADLFTPDGLRYQGRAARSGLVAALLWLLALVAWVLLAP